MEQLTADETAAMQAMQADTAPVEPAEPAAPVVLAEPAPAAPETAPEAPEAAKPPPGMVPQQALHQERERRKEIERRFAEMEAQLAKLTAPPPQEIVVPDPVLQPEAFKKWQVDQIKAHAEKLAEVERNAQESVLLQRLDRDVAQFRVAMPDYDNAYKFAVQSRERELALYGYSPEHIAQQIEVDVRYLVQQAYAEGKNPGAKFYEFAQVRGYAPQPAPSQVAAQQVQAFAEAQRQTQSLAPAGGPSNDGGMTLEAMAKLSEAELAAMPRAKRDEIMRKLMGG